MENRNIEKIIKESNDARYSPRILNIFHGTYVNLDDSLQGGCLQ